MDFRSMLKKKKYAKWGNDDEGLYVSPQTMLLFCYWLYLSLYVTNQPSTAINQSFSAMVINLLHLGPDWGDLKHHDKPEEPVLKDEKPVSFSSSIFVEVISSSYLEEICFRNHLS